MALGFRSLAFGNACWPLVGNEGMEKTIESIVVLRSICQFPKTRGTFLGVIRTVVYWIYIGVPLFWETGI